MNLFGKKNKVVDAVLGGLLGDTPIIIEKVGLVFTDVETEGKKQGYQRAASIYEQVFREMESRYQTAIEFLMRTKDLYESESSILVNWLESLERESERLQKEYDAKLHSKAEELNMTTQELKGAFAAGCVGPTGNGLWILDLVYSHKEKKLAESIWKGYLEAKDIYKKKIRELKDEYEEKLKKGNEGLEKLVSTMDDIMNDIAAEQMKIAELSLLSEEIR